MDNLLIETPEQIPLEFALAGIGSRFLALAVDTCFQLAAGALLAAIALPLGLAASPKPPRGGWVLAIIVILWFLLQSGYFAIFEAVWHGQTPGKRLMRLRVIEDSGRPITVYEAVARNLLRIIDALPVLYGVGIVSALLSAQSKRLGDHVAGTVVVYEVGAVLNAPLGADATPSPIGARYDTARLTPEEFQLIEAFLLRRSELPRNVREDTARKILARLSGRLQLVPGDEQKPEPVLEALATAYRARARFG
jgi:uncharacterized RDD family membrane protein YckC